VKSVFEKMRLSIAKDVRVINLMAQGQLIDKENKPGFDKDTPMTHVCWLESPHECILREQRLAEHLSQLAQKSPHQQHTSCWHSCGSAN